MGRVEGAEERQLMLHVCTKLIQAPRLTPLTVSAFIC